MREKDRKRDYVSRRILSVGIANYGLQREFESDPVCLPPTLRGGIIIIPRDTRHDSFVIGGKLSGTCARQALLEPMQLKRGNKLILFAVVLPISYSLDLIP